MKRFRAQLACLAPFVAGLFALAMAVPRAALFYHEHAGSGRAHAHAEDLFGIAELLDHHHQHDSAHDHAHGAGHHAHGAPADRHAAGVPSRHALAADDGSSNGHWHEQPRFHRSVVARAPIIATIALVSTAPTATARQSSRAAALERHARAPPSPLSHV